MRCGGADSLCPKRLHGSNPLHFGGFVPSWVDNSNDRMLGIPVDKWYSSFFVLEKLVSGFLGVMSILQRQKCAYDYPAFGIVDPLRDEPPSRFSAV